MKASFVFLFLTLALYLGISCEKKESSIIMHYNENGCANPWNQDSEYQIGFGINDPDYQNKVKDYLEQYGINIKSISVTNDGPISGCFSCFCSTGRRINISISEKDKNLAEELGFTLD